MRERERERERGGGGRREGERERERERERESHSLTLCGHLKSVYPSPSSFQLCNKTFLVFARPGSSCHHRCLCRFRQCKYKRQSIPCFCFLAHCRRSLFTWELDYNSNCNRVDIHDTTPLIFSQRKQEAPRPLLAPSSPPPPPSLPVSPSPRPPPSRVVGISLFRG